MRINVKIRIVLLLCLAMLCTLLLACGNSEQTEDDGSAEASASTPPQFNSEESTATPSFAVTDDRLWSERY